MKKTAIANTPATDELYNIENYDDAEIYDILGLPEDFDRESDDNNQLLANAILKQIQKFSNISPDGSSDEAKKMAKFFLDMYELFFPEKTVADTVENAYDDQDPDTIDDIASILTVNANNPCDGLFKDGVKSSFSVFERLCVSDHGFGGFTGGGCRIERRGGKLVA